MEAGCGSQHRTQVNPQTGFRAWASVPYNTTPSIRPRSGSSEGGGGETGVGGEGAKARWEGTMLRKSVYIEKYHLVIFI